MEPVAIRIQRLIRMGAVVVGGAPLPTYSMVYACENGSPIWSAAETNEFCMVTAGMNVTETFGANPLAAAQALGKFLGPNLLVLLDLSQLPGYIPPQPGVNPYCAYGC